MGISLRVILKVTMVIRKMQTGFVSSYGISEIVPNILLGGTGDGFLPDEVEPAMRDTATFG